MPAFGGRNEWVKLQVPGAAAISRKHKAIEWVSCTESDAERTVSQMVKSGETGAHDSIASEQRVRALVTCQDSPIWAHKLLDDVAICTT